MNINFNQVINFIGKWLAIGIVGYFGWKLGGMLDGVLTFI
jgi:hypothetical protein